MRTTNRLFVCEYCGKEQEKRRYNQRFCNNSCNMHYRYEIQKIDKNEITKKANETWRRIKKEQFINNPRRFISKRGYWIISVPERGNLNEHQYVWEKNYGKIPNDWVIHHINHNKLDNRIENLQIMPSKEHAKLHDRLRKRNKKGQFI